jgi:hypothetical protein
MKIKLKRTFKFKKVRKNIQVNNDNTYEFTTIKDSFILRYAIAAALNKDIKICEFACSEYSDEGFITVYSTHEDFISFIADLLDTFADYIITCQF